MNISAKSIVSNSDMIKNYKACRMMANKYGKIFILKNNRPDAVLLSIEEYERVSLLLEYMESLEEKDIARVLESLPIEGFRKTYTMENLKKHIE